MPEEAWHPNMVLTGRRYTLAARSRKRSSAAPPHCVIEACQPVEHDLDADANHDERRQADQNTGAGGTQYPLQSFRKPVAKEDSQAHEGNADDCGQRTEDQLQVG